MTERNKYNQEKQVHKYAGGKKHAFYETVKSVTFAIRYCIDLFHFKLTLYYFLIITIV